ncbi:MAG: MATE family efflux transporter [Muribaculaceae bacterium]|nr:MATE family efflux transporter [Muribaculaceae bacterium]
MRKTDREIFAIAVPSIVANITTPLLGLVDIAIVGHMGSPAYIAAIALGSTMFSMIYWVFAFLRMGTSGTTAQAYGASDIEERDASLYRAMSVALFIGLFLVAVHSPLRTSMLRFFSGDPEVTALAARYFDILIYGAPATMGLYVVNGWLIGVQNSRYTMFTSLIINVVNILASLTLVYALHFGIDGVATGTLIAQWTGFIAGCLMIRRYRPMPGTLKRLADKVMLKRFFSVNINLFLRTLCLVAVTVWFTRAGARQGDIVLSVNALIMQLFILFSYMMDGFAFAGEALAGKLTGAGRIVEKRELICRLFFTGGIVSLVFTAAYAMFGDDILRLLSNDMPVVALSGEYLWWGVSIPFAGAGAFIWDGIFVGETRTRPMLVSMAIAMTIFFAVYFILVPVLGNHALWLAFILYLVTRGIVQTIYYLRGRK